MKGGSVIAAQGAQSADRLAEAHRALLADPAVQFALHPPAPPRPMPEWLRRLGEWIGDALRPIGRLFAEIDRLMPDAPYARILLWTMLALAAAGLAWTLWNGLRGGDWRSPFRRRQDGPAVTDEVHWTPEAAPARRWLTEADALAGQGLYCAAAHHLLMRSVEDIGRRRPDVVRPALTSRELAATPILPPLVRRLFADIARVVERGVFGGKPVLRQDWDACRAAYAEFARPASWQAA